MMSGFKRENIAKTLQTASTRPKNIRRGYDMTEHLWTGHWDHGLTKLNRLIKKASSVLGSPLVEVVGDRRMMAKLSSLSENIFHPMQSTVTALSSSFSDRLLHPWCVKERYCRSFLPAAVEQTQHSVDHTHRELTNSPCAIINTHRLCNIPHLLPLLFLL